MTEQKKCPQNTTVKLQKSVDKESGHIVVAYEQGREETSESNKTFEEDEEEKVEQSDEQTWNNKDGREKEKYRKYKRIYKKERKRGVVEEL